MISSPSCERNKKPILDTLTPYLKGRTQLLEIGSGTGQHAAHIAPFHRDLVWHPTDLRENHEGILQWTRGIGNVQPPLEIDILDTTWPEKVAAEFDIVFTANTLHIVAQRGTEILISGLPKVLKPSGVLAIYGPFNYKGDFTSDSNRQFEQWLKSQGPQMGIRDFEYVDKIASDNGFELIKDHSMPANNRLLTYALIR